MNECCEISSGTEVDNEVVRNPGNSFLLLCHAPGFDPLWELEGPIEIGACEQEYGEILPSYGLDLVLYDSGCATLVEVPFEDIEEDIGCSL